MNENEIPRGRKAGCFLQMFSSMFCMGKNNVLIIVGKDDANFIEDGYFDDDVDTVVGNGSVIPDRISGQTASVGTFSLFGFNQLFVGILRSEGNKIEALLNEFASIPIRRGRGEEKRKIFSKVLEEIAQEKKDKADMLENVTLISVSDYTNKILFNMYRDMVALLKEHEEYLLTFDYPGFRRSVKEVREFKEDLVILLRDVEFEDENSAVSKLAGIISKAYSDRAPFYIEQSVRFRRRRQQYQYNVYLNYGLALYDYAEILAEQS